MSSICIVVVKAGEKLYPPVYSKIMKPFPDKEPKLYDPLFTKGWEALPVFPEAIVKLEVIFTNVAAFRSQSGV